MDDGATVGHQASPPLSSAAEERLGGGLGNFSGEFGRGLGVDLLFDGVLGLGAAVFNRQANGVVGVVEGTRGVVRDELLFVAGDGVEGMVTFCSPMTICPWVMSWRACLMVLAGLVVDLGLEAAVEDLLNAQERMSSRLASAVTRPFW